MKHPPALGGSGGGGGGGAPLPGLGGRGGGGGGAAGTLAPVGDGGLAAWAQRTHTSVLEHQFFSIRTLWPADSQAAGINNPKENR